jgi:putative membrane-bound dehydrogenase-like protein
MIDVRMLLAALASLGITDALLAQGFPPEEAVRRMTAADGFQVRLVASEPMVRQPVAIEFDDRGRLWVIQYLQYPNPAGLKRIKVDRYSRTVYDRMPEPPPRGPKGDDRITILYDYDKDGRAHKAKDFVNGLNLASGIAFGHGGVFVLQAPYLLFYRDRNGDDVADGDPEVLLTGFGMEDAHSLANSLTWGPDGWLYGCQGSTVTAHIRGIEFQQGVWRYHPITHRFELFCEGGGNSWGLDFDRHGNLLYSTNVGGYCLLHGVQGAYYWKSFGKHGALHNPYAYGYFEHVPHGNFKGGHVTVGGIVYQGDSFPEHFRGKYIAADLLGHAVYWHNLEPSGSSFSSSHGGELLLANDTWFAPSDLTLGPDGSVYVADWYDKRTAHPDPDADWDRSNGRIYKIEAKCPGTHGTKPCAEADMTKLSSPQLVALLSHPNDWYVRKARRILADRRDPEIIFPLRTLISESKDEYLALEALWALYVTGGFTEAFALTLLDHPNPDIRRWTVRLLGDECKVSPAVSKRLVELAATDSDASVLSQLASAAKRLPAEDGLPIVQRLLFGGPDTPVWRNQVDQDPHIPLLLWWAVERHAIRAKDAVVHLFASAEAWRTPSARDVIEERLMRRYAAEGTTAALMACARLLESAPTPEDRRRMLAALDQGLQDRPGSTTNKNTGDLLATHAVPARNGDLHAQSPDTIPSILADRLTELWKDDTSDPIVIRLMARLGSTAAQQRALALAIDSKIPIPTRVAMLQIVGEFGPPNCARQVLTLLDSDQAEAIQLAALDALHHFDEECVVTSLLAHYPKMTDRLRSATQDALLSRKSWALRFLQEIDRDTFPSQEIPLDQVRQISLHQDQQLDGLVHKLWGNVKGGTPEEKLAEVRRLHNDLRAGTGNPVRGRELFRKHCASCHRLYEEGQNVGPDLTHANRQDRDYLLVSIVDPSAVIRKEHLSYVVQATDGRVITGLLVEQTPNSITILNAKNERVTVPREKIESIQESAVSLMPENLLKDLQPQELRDLFSYLESDKPPK